MVLTVTWRVLQDIFNYRMPINHMVSTFFCQLPRNENFNFYSHFCYWYLNDIKWSIVDELDFNYDWLCVIINIDYDSLVKTSDTIIISAV